MTAVIDQLTLDLTRKLDMTAVVVTHDMTSAFRIGTKMIMLGAGKRVGTIIASGTPDEMSNHPDPEVQQFIKGEADSRVPLKLAAREYLDASSAIRHRTSTLWRPILLIIWPPVDSSSRTISRYALVVLTPWRTKALRKLNHPSVR